MKKLLLFVVTLLLGITIISCNHHKSREVSSDTTVVGNKADTANLDKAKKELLNKDIEFSDYSVSKGTSEAFINYIADDGVMLRQNHMPIVGKDSVSIIMNKRKKRNIKMNWTPLYADVAKSGELGYTYGTYTVQSQGADGQTSTSSGTYVSVWKKDKEGNWKLALDSGNEGLIPVKKNK